MPELPDVIAFEERIAEGALHHTVTQTHVYDERILEEGLTPQALGRHLKSQQLTETHRHGKYLMVRAGAEGWLTLHFGMTGEPRCFGEGEEPPDYTRLALDFDDNTHLAVLWKRMLGRAGFTDSPESLVREKQLGPDALDEDIDHTQFRDIFSRHDGMIKPLLMDQSLLAGVGNVYADEMLYQARIHPEQKASGIDESGYKRLFTVMRRVLPTAAHHRAKPEELPDGYLLRHRETDGKCPRCDHKLKKIEVGGRSTWLCSRCQG